MHIDRRNNDTQHKGHYPTFGQSRDLELDIVVQLLRWMRATGLAVHANCAKRARPAVRCDICPQLFPLPRCAQGGVTVVTSHPCSRQQASDWIRWAAKQAGGDPARSSGILALKGGISAAIESCVPEAILYLQSGHGQTLPARASPARFLETFEAFGLCLVHLVNSSLPFVRSLGSESVVCWWGYRGFHL